MLHAMTRGAFALVVVSAGAGCVDARDAFKDFGERVEDARTTEIDAPIVTSLPDINGEFYGVAQPYLGEGAEPRYFKFRMTYVFRAVTENTGELDWSAQALDKDTLEPVGEPFTANNVAVNEDATCLIPMVGTLDGRANTVSGS